MKNAVEMLIILAVGIVAGYNVVWPHKQAEAKAAHTWFDLKAGLVIESDRPRDEPSDSQAGFNGDPAKELSKKLRALEAIGSFRKRLEKSETKPAPETELGHVVEMILSVESGWDPKAVGDKGKAVGIAQTWRIVVDDVNRILQKKAFDYQDRLNPRRSREMAEIYLDHYGRAYQRATGKKAGEETLARIWNGGPRGWAKEKTAEYWRKAKDFLLESL